MTLNLTTERLLRLLPRAAAQLSEIDAYWAERCEQAARDVQAGSMDFVAELWLFFAPCCQWNDLTAAAGESAERLGNELYATLDALAVEQGLRERNL